MAKIKDIYNYKFKKIYIKYKIYIKIIKNFQFNNIIISDIFNYIFAYIVIF